MTLYQENRLQVRQNAIIGYTFTEYPRNATTLQKQRLRRQLREMKGKQYSGELKQGTKKRLTKAIELLCQTIKPKRQYNPITKKTFTHRLSFITLTIPQDHTVSAKEAYQKALSPFLLWLRRKHGMKTYIWKAEAQKRGQIHYHITTQAFIEHYKIKDQWNNLCQKAGWIDDYYKKHGHYSPNSTDIHSVKSVKNLSGYLCKEFCKSIQNPHTTGKVWDCSLNLKAYGYYTIIEQDANNKLLSEVIEKNQNRVTVTDFCFIINTRGLSQTDILTLTNLKDYDNHLQSIRTYVRD